MGIPIKQIVGAITSLSLEASLELTPIPVPDIVKKRVRLAMERHGTDLVQNAVDGLGIDIDVNNGLTDENITHAINKTFLADADFKLDSVFDREKMKAGLMREGIRRIAQILEIPDGEASILGVKVKLQDLITAEAILAIREEAGEIFEAAKERKKLRELIERNKGDRSQFTKPRDMSPEGVKNRERQARYRATHKRKWVPKPEVAAPEKRGA